MNCPECGLPAEDGHDVTCSLGGEWDAKVERDRRLLAAHVGRSDPTTGCRLWLGPVDPKGYGVTNPSGGTLAPKAHQLSYSLSNGWVPKGHVVHHRCGVHGCTRPKHLQALSRNDHELRHQLIRELANANGHRLPLTTELHLAFDREAERWAERLRKPRR